jgi:hypothetical protein
MRTIDNKRSSLLFVTNEDHDLYHMPKRLTDKGPHEEEVDQRAAKKARD